MHDLSSPTQTARKPFTQPSAVDPIQRAAYVARLKARYQSGTLDLTIDPTQIPRNLVHSILQGSTDRS